MTFKKARLCLKLEACRVFSSELEFGIGFCGGRKTREPRKIPPVARTRKSNKLSPYMALGLGIETESH